MKIACVRVSALLVAMGIPLVTLAEATDLVCVTPTKSQVEQFFNNWNAALQTLDPKKIVSLYAEDGVLLPTLYNIPRTNHQQLEDYFTYFVKKHPSGKIDSRTIRSGCDWATDTGVYTFTLYGDYPRDKQTVSARFSFAYEYIDGKWLIISHHSSLLPNSKEPVQDKQDMAELEPKSK